MVMELFFSFLLLILSLLLILLTATYTAADTNPKLPKSYPIIGSYFAIYANRHRRVQWLSDMIQASPSATFVLHRFMGQRQVFTGNPENVHHILKTHFHVYPKGDLLRRSLRDFLGDGIFNINGDTWKFQRQVSSHEFNRKSLRRFVETVVDTELSERLVPILAAAAESKKVLDLQDLLQRFTFDNICKIAFGYDPAYLLPSLPPAQFADAFEEAVLISSGRLNSILPIVWKLKKLMGLGSERRLKDAVSRVRDFARDLIREKKQQIETGQLPDDEVDILSRFLVSGHSDENFVIDIVISFIHAGRDTTSAALTWFFWLVSQNPSAEKEILKESSEKSGGAALEEVSRDEASNDWRNSCLARTQQLAHCWYLVWNQFKFDMWQGVRDMVYTQGALCESMRLYPPVPVDTKEATTDDFLPDGTFVKKGTRVVYHPYAMGRLEKIWGVDWPEFKPERWLERDELGSGKWSFAGRDPYTYPVFQAGPRICLGKEMAFLQMKRVVSAVVQRFKVVPAGADPEYFADLTSKMKGGFPVRIEYRSINQSM